MTVKCKDCNHHDVCHHRIEVDSGNPMIQNHELCKSFEPKKDAKQLKQPCQICRKHKGGKPMKIRDDHGTLFEATHIAHCPYCGRYLAENYETQTEEEVEDDE